MPKRLLDRQVSLLNYLTSSEAIFGAGHGPVCVALLRGIDRSLLDLEARFSHEKRMAKIQGVFPKTFALLGPNKDAVVRAFAEACPPVEISRIENARQFYQFLCERRRHDIVDPPHLRDVATCELACASVIACTQEKPGDSAPGRGQSAPHRIRRRPGVLLLRCRYDIRPIFESGSTDTIAPARMVTLAVAMQPAANRPEIFEIAPVAFELLSALDNWSDPAAFGIGRAHRPIIEALVKSRLLEVSA
jgi:hypothetical protein